MEDLQAQINELRALLNKPVKFFQIGPQFININEIALISIDVDKLEIVLSTGDRMSYALEKDEAENIQRFMQTNSFFAAVG